MVVHQVLASLNAETGMWTGSCGPVGEIHFATSSEDAREVGLLLEAHLARETKYVPHLERTHKDSVRDAVALRVSWGTFWSAWVEQAVGPSRFPRLRRVGILFSSSELQVALSAWRASTYATRRRK